METLSIPVAVPVSVGVKVMLTLQLLPKASVIPHLLAEIANGLVILKPVRSSVAVPEFTFLMATFFGFAGGIDLIAWRKSASWV